MKKQVVCMAVIFALALSVSAIAGTGSGAGYRWADSATVSGLYSWQDISSSGTAITSWTSTDDGHATITTPFAIKYCGTDHAAASNFYVGSNGFVGWDTGGMDSLGNTDLPNSGTPNNSMYMLWDDLYGTTGYNCRYQTLGSTPNRIFVVSFCNWWYYGYTTNPIAFQILIYENDGTYNNTILMQYADVYGAAPGHDSGYSATVGLENSGGTAAAKFSYNTVSLSAGLAIGYWDENKATPSPFTLSQPPDGSTVDFYYRGGNSLGGGITKVEDKLPADSDVYFEWNASTSAGPGAITYDFIADTDPAFGSPDYTVTGITGTNTTVYFTGVTTDTVYYWRVTAKESVWNLTRQCTADFHFTAHPVDSTPTTFNLLTPTDGAIIQVSPKSTGLEGVSAGVISQMDNGGKTTVPVTFTWEESTTSGPGDLTYNFFADDDPGFGSIDYSATGLTDETVDINFSITADITYYWRVEATEDEFGHWTRCNDDFSIIFDYAPFTAIQPASLGHVKSMYH